MISFLVRNYLSVKILEPQKCLGNAQFKKSLQMWLICFWDPCLGMHPSVT